MSGSSNAYVPEFKSTKETDCSTLSVKTNLTNPVADVILKLVAGSRLEVIKVASSIQVMNADGELAGVLLTRDRDRIINCIDSGYEFYAVVLRISGANCEILVKAK